MTRLLSLISVLAVVWVAPLAAQDRDQTLADIRQELSVLFVEIQRLKRELSTTGSPSVSVQGTSALQRIDAIEAELSRLTAATEALDNRVNRVVADGTNRIGDLEFRLVELEGGDLGQLGETTTLGGDDIAAVLPATPAAPVLQPETGGVELAASEQYDFDEAKGLYETGSYADAADKFQVFSETYLGGPLTGQAHFWRGESLDALGDKANAARAYLEAFSGDPNGSVAPDALLRLGQSLNALGQFDESCVMLDQVSVRFPSSPASIEAQTARASFGCG